MSQHTTTHLHVAHEAGLPPQGGPVLLDIGDDIGALIVRMDRELLGTELHVLREGEHHTTHTGVWERRVGLDEVVVAVFPALAEGSYSIVDGHGGLLQAVTVEGGQITEIDLRTW
jgi:hypothetical protein